MVCEELFEVVNKKKNKKNGVISRTQEVIIDKVKVF